LTIFCHLQFLRTSCEKIDFSFDFGFDVDSEYEDILQEWIAIPDSSIPDAEADPDVLDFRVARTESRKVMTKKLAKNLRRRSLSESICDVTYNLVKIQFL
jgi:hypothetical protein